MKEAFIRFLVHLAILVCLRSIFGSWPTAPEATFSARLTYYLGFFIISFGFWMIVFEAIFRAVRWAQRRQ